MNKCHSPRKRFGQHFLKHSVILEKMIASIQPRTTDTIVEIGPGQGALTDFLINECGQLILVEIDRDLVTFLKKKYTNPKNLKKLTIHQSDVLQFDFSTLDIGNKPLRILGNLPYNISTPLLFHLFAQIALIEDMHFMLQKEVVLRLTAPVENADYGRLSIMSQFFCNNTLLFNVPANAFSPPPPSRVSFCALDSAKNCN